MNIAISDDGKGKCMSFEAKIHLNSLYGFGANKEEALLELKTKIEALIAELTEKLEVVEL